MKRLDNRIVLLESLFDNIIITHHLEEMLVTFPVSQSLPLPFFYFLFLAVVELALTSNVKTLWRTAVLTPGSFAKKCWGSALACEPCHPRCKLGDRYVPFRDRDGQRQWAWVPSPRNLPHGARASGWQSS